MKETSEAILQPEELKPAVDLINAAIVQLDRVLLGRADLHRMVMVAILSRGHVLLEGVPGVGKTALVKALGRILTLDFKRVQFTPDLMPGDILGTHILQEGADGTREMSYHPGPVFTNLLLADEINRASPKTQSALLEAMQEQAVTLLGTTRKLPSPFFVLASQNPIELEGTYPLPEAQLDRFLFKLVVSNVEVEVLDRIISTRRRGEAPEPTERMGYDELRQVFDVMDRVYLPAPVSRYISRLVAATHPGSREATAQVSQYVSYGASPRAAIAIAEAARGHALVEGRPTVGFEDVKSVAPSVINHRLVLNYKARLDQLDAFTIIAGLLSSIDETGLKLAGDIEIVGARRE
ncbi:MAG TPA: AAA family ATPase [Blastocatellia bacterium]|nr:AAA family ATPase [Blastocatellia bacterium]